MKNYIVFDCYQTLIYKKDLERIVQKFLADEMRIKISLKYIKYAFDAIYHRYKFQHPRFESAQDRKEFYIKYNKELMGIIGVDVSSDFAGRLNQELGKLSSYTCYPDVIPALKYFKIQKKIPLSIIANWTETLEKILEDTNLRQYFNFVHSSHNLKLEKPNPEIFKKTLAEIIEKYDKVYYIGDDYELDIVPARQANLIPVLIDRNNRYPKNVDCIKIRNLNNLKKIVR